LWTSRAEAIHVKIIKQAWSERRQSFVESFGGVELDASVVLMGEVGFLTPQDVRFRRTVLALENALCDGPYMRRYEAEDDFGRPESSFNACSFWRVDALARIGEKDKARELFQVLLARCNHVGLLSEDMSPKAHELWGNFPQTYSMVGIINGAVRLSKRWDAAV
jgi:GH15 family glucan-1,4-alpha-glucosidase